MSDAPRCQTCRHWEQHDDLPAGLCLRIKDANGDYSWPPQVEIRSDEGFAYLWVPESFGCVEHAPAVQEPTEETP